MLTHHLRKLAALAFVGLAAAVLIGPVLAVLGVLLAFAVVGWLARLGYYGLRRALVGRGLRKALSSARQAVWAAGRLGRRLVAGGAPRRAARVAACLRRACEAEG